MMQVRSCVCVCASICVWGSWAHQVGVICARRSLGMCLHRAWDQRLWLSLGGDGVALSNPGNFYCNPQIVMMESPRCGGADYISRSPCPPFISGIYSSCCSHTATITAQRLTPSFQPRIDLCAYSLKAKGGVKTHPDVFTLIYISMLARQLLRNETRCATVGGEDHLWKFKRTFQILYLSLERKNITNSCSVKVKSLNLIFAIL